MKNQYAVREQFVSDDERYTDSVSLVGKSDSLASTVISVN